MAFDEWMLLRAVRSREMSARLYSWYPGAITIGRNQDFDRAVDASMLNGTVAVRRITGGRAIYHDPSEITYSFAIPSGDAAPAGLSGSASQASRRLADVLTEFVRLSGHRAEIAERSSQQLTERSQFHKAPCFASMARHEITVSGRKVVASAQFRDDGGLLQHGSVKISGVAAHAALIRVDDEGTERLPELEAAAFVTAAERFREVCEAVLGMVTRPSVLEPHEVLEIASVADFVRGHAVERRNSIKRIADCVSLFHDRQ
jgi:lipoate-protein ligase A